MMRCLDVLINRRPSLKFNNRVGKMLAGFNGVIASDWTPAVLELKGDVYKRMPSTFGRMFEWMKWIWKNVFRLRISLRRWHCGVRFLSTLPRQKSVIWWVIGRMMLWCRTPALLSGVSVHSAPPNPVSPSQSYVISDYLIQNLNFRYDERLVGWCSVPLEQFQLVHGMVVYQW